MFNIYRLCVCLCECVCHFVNEAVFAPSSSQLHSKYSIITGSLTFFCLFSILFCVWNWVLVPKNSPPHMLRRTGYPMTEDLVRPLDRGPRNRPKYKQKSVQPSGPPRLTRPDKAEWDLFMQCFLVWRLLEMGWLCFSSQLCKLWTKNGDMLLLGSGFSYIKRIKG